MSELTDRRRDTLRLIVEKRGGVSKVSKMLGYTNPSFMSQMIGPNPTREITEKTARKFEEKLGLEHGTCSVIRRRHRAGGLGDPHGRQDARSRGCGGRP